MRKFIVALMGMGLASGCYVGVEDTGDDYSLERGGKACYYSYYSGSSTSYSSNSGSSEKLELGMNGGFTVEVPKTANNNDPRAAFHALAMNALAAAPGQHMLSCAQNENIDRACAETCYENGAAPDSSGTIVCPVCVDGTKEQREKAGCDVDPALKAQEQERPYDGKGNRYFLRDAETLGLTISITEAVDRGEFWVAEVVVEGECNCACDPE